MGTSHPVITTIDFDGFPFPDGRPLGFFRV